MFLFWIVFAFGMLYFPLYLPIPLGKNVDIIRTNAVFRSKTINISDGRRKGNPKVPIECVCVCAWSLCTRVFAALLCVSLQNLGEESLLILALGHSLSPLSASMDLHPSSASAEGHAVMRWELTFIVPGGGNTATNRDILRFLSMTVLQLCLCVCALECISCAGLCVNLSLHKMRFFYSFIYLAFRAHEPPFFLFSSICTRQSIWWDRCNNAHA